MKLHKISIASRLTATAAVLSVAAPATLTGALTAVTPGTAAAQERATSALTGIALPSGAAPGDR